METNPHNPLHEAVPKETTGIRMERDISWMVQANESPLQVGQLAEGVKQTKGIGKVPKPILALL